MPFVFNRVYYDHCTRTKTDGTAGVESFYWCPSPSDVTKVDLFDDNLIDSIFTANGKYGKCYDYLKPPGNVSALIAQQKPNMML